MQFKIAFKITKEEGKENIISESSKKWLEVSSTFMALPNPETCVFRIIPKLFFKFEKDQQSFEFSRQFKDNVLYIGYNDCQFLPH